MVLISVPKCFLSNASENALQQNKLVRNLEHYARSVSCLVVSSLCTTMPHVLKYTQCIIHKVMTLVAVDVDNHAYSTCIMLVGSIIQSISHLLLSY